MPLTKLLSPRCPNSRCPAPSSKLTLTLKVRIGLLMSYGSRHLYHTDQHQHGETEKAAMNEADRLRSLRVPFGSLALWHNCLHPLLLALFSPLLRRAAFPCCQLPRNRQAPLEMAVSHVNRTFNADEEDRT